MRKGLGIVTGQFPALTDGSPEGIMKWANELIRLLNLKDIEHTGVAATGYDITNPVTADRTLDATAGTAAEVRAVLATLISDMLASGKLGN